jgi:hypothetical protein
MAWRMCKHKRSIVHFLFMVALLAYGLTVDPDTGKWGIPCLWKALLGINCPGCGLSRAGALLLHGRFAEAARMNWLIFPFVMVSTCKCVGQILRRMDEFQDVRLSERVVRWRS